MAYNATVIDLFFQNVIGFRLAGLTCTKFKRTTSRMSHLKEKKPIFVKFVVCNPSYSLSLS